QFMNNYANLYVRDALMRVNGVGDVMAFGQPFSMRVWLDADKLANLNLTPADVNAAIQEQNLRMPRGSGGARPQQSDHVFESPVLPAGDLDTEEELKQLVVKPKTGGSLASPAHTARVELGQSAYTSTSTVNGRPASSMMINQMPGSNAVQT